MGEEEDRQKKVEWGGGRGERNACYKGPIGLFRKILIGYSDNRTGL